MMLVPVLLVRIALACAADATAAVVAELTNVWIVRISEGEAAALLENGRRRDIMMSRLPE